MFYNLARQGTIQFWRALRIYSSPKGNDVAVARVELKANLETGRGFWVTESGTRTAVFSAILAIATIAVYLPVHSHTFFNFDDNYYVVDNEHVHQGLDWATVKWAFTSLDHANWIPLSFLSHAVDYQLFGDDPAGHHEVNVLLHATTAALLFWVLKRSTGYVGRSFMVGALFALHPMNVEAVAWIAERKTLLSVLFFVLALGAYDWYAREPKESRYRLVALLFALGLASKSQIITLPFVFLLWDYWPLQRMSLGQEPSPEAKLPPLPQKSFRSLVGEKIPFLLLAVFPALMTLHSVAGAQVRFWRPLSQRLANAIFSYTQYFAKTLWPSNMAPMYPNRGASLAAWQVGACLGVLVTITALVIAGRRHRYLPVGWFWFLGTLVPVIQIFQFDNQGMADRFAYQALIGLFIAICWGVSDWAGQRQPSGAWLAAGSAVALLALTMVTHRQIGYWKDPPTLWAHALAVVPNNWVAEGQVGRELLGAGKTEEAMRHFRRAVTIEPDDGLSNIAIAVYDQQHGNLRDAVTGYQKALRDYSLLPRDVASVYMSMGSAYRALGEVDQARECLDKAAEWQKKWQKK